jgi:hypothetical protein
VYSWKSACCSRLRPSGAAGLKQGPVSRATTQADLLVLLPTPCWPVRPQVTGDQLFVVVGATSERTSVNRTTGDLFLRVG